MTKTQKVTDERIFVGGGWVGRAAPGKTFDVAIPANGEVLATLPDGGGQHLRSHEGMRSGTSRLGFRITSVITQE